MCPFAPSKYTVPLYFLTTIDNYTTADDGDLEFKSHRCFSRDNCIYYIIDYDIKCNIMSNC